MLSSMDINLTPRLIRAALRKEFKKDDITSSLFSDAGKRLPYLYSERFIRLLGEQTRLKGMVRFFSFRGVEGQIHTIDLATRTLYPHTEGTDPVVRTQPAMTKITVEPTWFDAPFYITDESLNINLEDKNLVQIMIELMATAMGRDYEKLIIHGDELGPWTNEEDRVSDYDADKVMVDPMLATIDGIITIAKAQGTELDVSGYTNKYFNKEIAKYMLLQLPEDRKFVKSQMKFFCSSEAMEDFYESLEDIGTDYNTIYKLIIGTEAPISYHGRLIHEIPLWENYPRVVEVDSFTSGGTVALSYPPIVADSIYIFDDGTTGEYITPYTEDIDYTCADSTGIVTHTGTASSMPTGTDMNITYKGSDVVIATPPDNVGFAMNSGLVTLEHDRIVSEAADLWMARTSCDVFAINGDDIVIATGLENASAS